MSPVDFKKRPCHPVEFKGQGPLFVYTPHGSGKVHQLLENPSCTPMPTVYPLQIRPVFVLS